MKYLILDTNIFLNMVVNRNKCINVGLIETFIKLLANKEIKLIVPNIVKYETLKHLDNEISKVGSNLYAVKKNVESLYWVNGLKTNQFNLDDVKKNVNEDLKTAINAFEENKEKYMEEINKLIKKLFENKEVINIEENDELVNRALKRKIYKKAPCHNPNKNSDADALIIEVLINLNKYIDIQESDQIYFISENTSDFSMGKSKKNELHKDIKTDIENVKLSSFIEYRINFAEFINKDLKDEVKNANLNEEFEQEFEQYQKARDDSLRESCDLPALATFEYWMKDEISKDRNSKQLEKQLQEIYDLNIELEEKSNVYEEKQDDIKNYSKSKIREKNSVIEQFNQYLIKNKERFYCYEINDIFDWLEIKKKEVSNFDDITNFDGINIEDEIFFVDSKQKKYSLIWNYIDLCPKNGESHTIECLLKCLNNKENNITGNIEVIYGFVEENDEGNIADSCSSQIDVNIENIIGKIEEIKIGLYDLTQKHENYIENLKKIICFRD